MIACQIEVSTQRKLEREARALTGSAIKQNIAAHPQRKVQRAAEPDLGIGFAEQTAGLKNTAMIIARNPRPSIGDRQTCATAPLNDADDDWQPPWRKAHGVSENAYDDLDNTSPVPTRHYLR